jgi:hypothetical protein
MKDPIASPGWYVVKKKVPHISCSAESQVIREYCPISLPCDPALSCLGENICGLNFEGERCVDCVVNSFRILGLCHSCEMIHWSWCFLFLIVILFLLAIYLNRITSSISNKRINVTAYFIIIVDYIQTVAIFVLVDRMEVPSVVANLLVTISIFNLQSSIIFGSCWGLNHSYEFIYFFTNFFPIIGVLIFSATLLLFNLFQRIKINKSLFNRIYAAIVLVFAFCFGTLFNNNISVFNCISTIPSDGNEYLSSLGPITNAICYSSGSIQKRLSNYAIFFLIFYMVTIPYLVYSAKSLRDRKLIEFGEDQGISESSEVNLGDENFHDYHSRIYSTFAIKYSIILELFKKALLLTTIFGCRGYIILTLSLLSLIIFGRLMIHLVLTPLKNDNINYLIVDAKYSLRLLLSFNNVRTIMITNQLIIAICNIYPFFFFFFTDLKLSFRLDCTSKSTSSSCN